MTRTRGRNELQTAWTPQLMLQVRLNPRLLLRTLTAILILLIVGHLLSQISKHVLGVPYAYGLVELFDMDVEANFPTFFSGFQLLLCGLLLALIGAGRRHLNDPFARHWQVLAVIFLLLALDEMVSMHELTIRMGWEFAPSLANGIFYWIWVVPASVFVVFVAVSYARFVFSYLPAVTRRRTIFGAALFVGGALGVEMFEARHVQQHGMENLTMGFYVLVEESMEKVGILVFLSGILDYLRSSGGVAVEVKEG
jgi:hypothetical protein